LKRGEAPADSSRPQPPSRRQREAQLSLQRKPLRQSPPPAAAAAAQPPRRPPSAPAREAPPPLRPPQRFSTRYRLQQPRIGPPLRRRPPKRDLLYCQPPPPSLAAAAAAEDDDDVIIAAEFTPGKAQRERFEKAQREGDFFDFTGEEEEEEEEEEEVIDLRTPVGLRKPKPPLPPPEARVLTRAAAARLARAAG